MALGFQLCPRCSSPLSSGFVNAGQGPFRWHEKGSSGRGGELLLDKPRIWGRQRTPALRCLDCHLVLFEFDPDARKKMISTTRH